MPNLVSTNDPNKADREKVLDLHRRRTAIEAEIAEYESVLESQDNVGMHGPLLTHDGYPRADIDLVAVRTARNRIICLNNDYTALMKQIEEEMHNFFDKVKSQAPPTSNQISSNGDSPMEVDRTPEAFLKVRSVAAQSPADKAGLRIDDLILNFGSIKKSNFHELADVKALCDQAVGQPIPVSVLRQGAVVDLVMIPGGSGSNSVLGCYLEKWQSL